MANEALRALDRRVVIAESERLVVQLEPGFERSGRHTLIALTVSAGIACGFVAWWFFRPHVDAFDAALLALVIAASGLFGNQRVTLVALVPENVLFVESKGVIGNPRRRKVLCRLSDVSGVEIRPRSGGYDSDVPPRYFELCVVDSEGKGIPVWYGQSEDAAKVLGEALLRLRGVVGAG
jgi:hypothetical protein